MEIKKKYTRKMAWLRSTPVHPEVEQIILEMFPTGVAEMILEIANNPPVLSMHYGVFCMPDDPCVHCKAVLDSKKRKRV